MSCRCRRAVNRRMTSRSHGSTVNIRIANCPKSAMSIVPSLLKSKYARNLAGPCAGGTAEYTFRREALVEVDGKWADAAVGRFSTADESKQFVAVIEGKGPRDPLDRPFAGRSRSAVEQALQYAVNLQIDWFVVTNLR